MSDLGENDGGETVFAEAWPPNQLEEDRVDLKSVRLSIQSLLFLCHCKCTNPFSRVRNRRFDNFASRSKAACSQGDLGKRLW